MNLKERFIFRGFHEDPQGEKVIYIEGKPVRGRWMLGDLKIVVHGGGDERYFIRAFHHNSKSWRVIPQTVAGFTGQYAKKRKIFEHDLLCFSCDDLGEIGAVYWNDEKSRYEVAVADRGLTSDLDRFYAEHAEVIGTVFDRKEGYDGIL